MLEFCQLLTVKKNSFFSVWYEESDNNFIRLIYYIRKQEEEEGINQMMTN